MSDLSLCNSLKSEKELKIIRRFENLESLNISITKIKYFDINWLLGLTRLTSLRISNCEIKTIKFTSDSSISEGQQSSQEQQSQSSRLPRLEKLNLAFDELNRDMFRGLTCLKLLNLSFNKLKCLPDGVFADLVNLEELVLMYDEITQVSEATFAGLVQLKTLYLSNNPFKRIDPSTFVNMMNLQDVYLDYKNLTNFDALEELFKARQINYQF